MEYRKIFRDEFHNLLCGSEAHQHQQTAQLVGSNQIRPAEQQNRNIPIISSVNILPRVAV